MRKAVNFRPAVYICCGLIFGILFSYFIVTKSVLGAVLTAIFFLSFLVLFLFFSTLKTKRSIKAVWFIAFIILAVIGGASFFAKVGNFDNANVNGHKLTVTGSVTEVTFYDGYGYAVIDGVTFGGVINGKTVYKIYAVIYGEENLELGDRITFSSVITDKSIYFAERFSSSAVSEGVKYYTEIKSSDISVLSNSPSVFQRLNIFIKETLKKGMQEDEFAVAYAMLTGNFDYISQETLSAYRSAGVAHIFAVSGLHIGVLTTALFFVLKKIKLNDKIAFITATFLGCFYAGICGFSASSVRAVVMFFMLNFARSFGFKYDGLSAVFTAAFLILIINPVQMFCVGFKLSFAVVFTIIVLNKPIKRILKFMPEKLSSAIAVSVSAELGGIPVMLNSFGNFSFVAALINILIIPAISAVFIMLLICVILGGMFFPHIFLFLPKYALFGLNRAFNFIDFNALVIYAGGLGVFTVLYYAVVVLSGGLINLKRTAKTIVCVILSLICLAGSVFISVNAANGVYVNVVGSDTISAVFMSGKEGNLLVISDVSHVFSANKIKKSALKTNDVTVVLLDNQKRTDIQVLLSKLNYVLQVKELYYCGIKEEDSEFVISKYYKDITVKNVSDGFSVNFCGNDFCITANGRCFLGKAGEKIIAICSKFDDYGDYKNFAKNPDIVICSDKFDGIRLTYSPEKIISFRYSHEYKNGEAEGIYGLRIA